MITSGRMHYWENSLFRSSLRSCRQQTSPHRKHIWKKPANVTSSSACWGSSMAMKTLKACRQQKESTTRRQSTMPADSYLSKEQRPNVNTKSSYSSIVYSRRWFANHLRTTTNWKQLSMHRLYDISLVFRWAEQNIHFHPCIDRRWSIDQFGDSPFRSRPTTFLQNIRNPLRAVLRHEGGETDTQLSGVPGNLVRTDWCGSVEHLGTGTTDMIDDCEAYGLKSPEFIQDDEFRVIIWRKESNKGEVKSNNAEAKSNNAAVHNEANWTWMPLSTGRQVKESEPAVHRNCGIKQEQGNSNAAQEFPGRLG